MYRKSLISIRDELEMVNSYIILLAVFIFGCGSNKKENNLYFPVPYANTSPSELRELGFVMVNDGKYYERREADTLIQITFEDGKPYSQTWRIDFMDSTHRVNQFVLFAELRDINRRPHRDMECSTPEFILLNQLNNHLYRGFIECNDNGDIYSLFLTHYFIYY